MKKMDYNKILNQLIEEYPHEIDKIEQVVKDAEKNHFYLTALSYQSIIESAVWNAEEKVRLIKFRGYNKHEQKCKYINKYGNEDWMNAYSYILERNNLSSFEAFMRTFKDIESHHVGVYITKDAAFRSVIGSILYHIPEELKATYMEIAIESLDEEDRKRLMQPIYQAHYIGAVKDNSLMGYIIKTKDLNLIKKYMPYIEDASLYIAEAVETGDKEIVEYFLEEGADINYYPKEPIHGKLTPLKMAIYQNDFEMVNYLLDHGANINLQVKEENFWDQLMNHGLTMTLDETGFLAKDLLERDIFFRKEKGEEKDKDAENLKFIRESSPLEFAIKLEDKYKDTNAFSYYTWNVNFKGHTAYIYPSLKINLPHVSNAVKNRGKIVDLLFDQVEDKSRYDITDLLAMSFITRDINQFDKYKNYALANHCTINFDYLFNLYFDFHMNDEKEMTDPFLDLLSQYDEEDLELKFFNTYLTRDLRNDDFYITDFNKKVLEKIKEEERTKLYLVPRCKDVNSVEALLSLGFDLNQSNTCGQNILFSLLDCYYPRDFYENKKELFNYLVDRIDLGVKDSSGKNVLYYALNRIPTKDEWECGTKEKVETLSDYELIVAKLITKMNKEDVCNADTMQMLERRLNFQGVENPPIEYAYIYNHHKDLFDALISKGFRLNKVLFDHTLKELNPTHEVVKERQNIRIDKEATLEYLYEKLDKDTKIQKCDIKQAYKDTVCLLPKDFEEYKLKFFTFKETIDSLKYFYSHHVVEKNNPEEYLKYVEEKYNTTYKNLDSYLVRMMIAGLRRYGNDKITDILELCPGFDINSLVYEESIEMSIYEYLNAINEECCVCTDGDIKLSDERFEAENVYDENCKVLLVGGLMQYAILDNDINLVKTLQEKGANLELFIGEENHTWDYVNSKTMKKYMEENIGKEDYKIFDGNEKSYYLSLFEGTQS